MKLCLLLQYEFEANGESLLKEPLGVKSFDLTN